MSWYEMKSNVYSQENRMAVFNTQNEKRAFHSTTEDRQSSSYYCMSELNPNTLLGEDIIVFD